ncbi:MAG: FliI/YscN family ATPase [Rhodobacteraceae bacterium]|nr:FliI/YscN family ATPase [Paracoccaceae bacterium]
MNPPGIDALRAGVARIRTDFDVGRVSGLGESELTVSGLGHIARLGDVVRIQCRDGSSLLAEIRSLTPKAAQVLPRSPVQGASIGDRAILMGPEGLAPDDSWIGRVIDPFGAPMDGKPLLAGKEERRLEGRPPRAAARRSFGPRLETGQAAFNTFLPLVRGQRIGLFAGSGVGKSTLLAHLARHIDADVVVIGLIGERGREVNHFIEAALGAEGMQRSVVVAATADQSPGTRRRCAWSAMAVAEHFRDAGHHVLLVMDSITRFAEAHRDISIAQGEPVGPDGFPASTSRRIMELAERAGPGSGVMGDITAIMSVLVAGSDMDGPIADILRGVLDGHVVLERSIAERGRFPAVDILRSVSRSLPQAASPSENGLLLEARKLLGAYDAVELMLKSGLYEPGNDAITDRAVRIWHDLDGFLAGMEPHSAEESFDRLRRILTATP